MLAESGLTYTMLRENIYADILLLSAPAAVAQGVLASNEGEGAVGYVARDDIAATAAALLAEGGHEKYQPLTDEEYIANLVQYTGMPEEAARADRDLRPSRPRRLAARRQRCGGARRRSPADVRPRVLRGQPSVTGRLAVRPPGRHTTRPAL